MALQKFLMSAAPGSLSVSGKAQWAIDQANAFRQANQGSAQLYDPVASGEVYQSPRRPWSAGAKAKQCIAVLDVAGPWTSPVQAKSFVRCESPAGTVHGASNATAMFNGNGATDFSIVGTGTHAAWTAPVTHGDYQERPEWSANKAIWDMRTHENGLVQSGGFETCRWVFFGGGEANWTIRFNYLLGSNDCWRDGVEPRPANAFKADHPFMACAANSFAGALKNLLLMDNDYDGMYTGYGPWQFGANVQSLFANTRSNGGTLWRHEPDNGVQSYGIHDIECRCGYAEKGNRGMSVSPADSLQPIDNLYTRDLFCYAMCDAIASNRGIAGQQGNGIASIDVADVYVMGATGASIQEAAPCQNNPSRSVTSIGVSGFTASPPKNVHYNGTFTGSVGGATRDTSFTTAADLLARWSAARVVLGTQPPPTSDISLSSSAPVVGTIVTCSARGFPGTQPHDWTVLWENSTNGTTWVTATGTGATTPISNTTTGDADADYTPNANDQGKFLRCTMTNTPTTGSGDTATTNATQRVVTSVVDSGADVPSGVVANFDGQVVGGRVKPIEGGASVSMPIGNNYVPQPGDVLIFFAVNED